MSMMGTLPGRLFQAKRLAMAIMPARPFLSSTILYRACCSGERRDLSPHGSNPRLPGSSLVDLLRQLSPVWPTDSPSAMAMRARMAPKPPGSSVAQTPRALVQSAHSGAPVKCMPRPRPVGQVAQTPVQASMAIRPCLISASCRNWVRGNMLGKVSAASSRVARPRGSHGFPPTSSKPVATERAVLEADWEAGANAAAVPTRVAKAAAVFIFIFYIIGTGN
mmetsp:Transcript_12467/g.29485  ORF Transcript_12467/g.29485 Transcript_12467/m.29485 type:complete len:221 (+) Transcript_12467:354-1016(+)